MSKKVLVTGCKFIGKHFVDYVLEQTDWEIIVLYRNNIGRIRDRVTYIQHDLVKPLFSIHDPRYRLPKLDYIVHMAAETYVDDSLVDCIKFVKSNVLGTANLLEWIKKYYPTTPTCIFSSDEVMGPAPEGVDFKEDNQRKPSNPYSATKGAAELLAYSFAHSFNLPIFVVRCMNVYGKGQAPQKFIPKVVEAFKKGEKITLHGTNKNNVASRHWVHARDCADAVMFLLDKAKPKEIYHITGEERSVYYIAEKILDVLMKRREVKPLPSFVDGVMYNIDDWVEYLDFHKARKGHDKRYSLSGEKLKAMGWIPKFRLDECLEEIV